ncbi:MAG: putative holin-like toxin [Lachnospiraceae bacterium]|nr:putative holin-like toxin [Lachnospiraceae bacterium]
MNTSVPSIKERRRFFMSTYEEFMVLLTFGILVVAILEYVNHKK